MFWTHLLQIVHLLDITDYLVSKSYKNNITTVL